MAEDGYVKDPSLSRSKLIGTADMVSPRVAPVTREVAGWGTLRLPLKERFDSPPTPLTLLLLLLLLPLVPPEVVFRWRADSAEGALMTPKALLLTPLLLLPSNEEGRRSQRREGRHRKQQQLEPRRQAARRTKTRWLRWLI